ncbi:family 10 glycosylhydrolase [Paenibacillus alvei]|uniref:Family 10 glycosylhydrolase n=1 Tax=Paenibacillus alvei TaxID=44250 RepID=A0ABT4GZ86_PAEAL|nr:family 10 glycosylhydrolase [Paenibacillus alvei]MCY9761984.1 family 10 glycosylhydrolase [Paenibacillus alvei]MCY9768560.1 family 10 glycosylhydrolase [Paenibacillus alvei]
MHHARKRARIMLMVMLSVMFMFSTIVNAYAINSSEASPTPSSEAADEQAMLPNLESAASSLLIDDFEQLQQLTASSARAVPGSVKAILTSRPDAVQHDEHAVKLTYDFTDTSGTSAAYLNFLNASGGAGRELIGYPSTIGVWVYGDGNKHWLRAQLQDGTGARPTIDFTTSNGLSWEGWRYVTANMPTNLVQPIKLNQLYVVETNDRNKNSGAISFDSLRAFYGATTVYEVTVAGLPPLQTGETKRVQVLATYAGAAEQAVVTKDAVLVSSDVSIVRVNADHTITGVGEGRAKLTIQYLQAPDSVYEVAVTSSAPAMQQLSLYGNPLMEIGQRVKTNAFARYESTPKPVAMLDGITYNSSNPKVASIDAAGMVTALESGTSVMKAVYGELTSFYELTVVAAQPKLEKIELSGLRAMTIGESLQGKVTAYYSNGTSQEVTSSVMFKTSQPKTATVDATGVIAALQVGISSISATYGGKTADFTLVVNKNSSPPKRQLRAAWIASVVNIDWPREGVVTEKEQKRDFIQLLNELEAAGMNAVVMQIKPTADAFYPSKYAPWSEWLTGVQGKDPGYNPLQFMIEEAHKRNMEFHAWFNPYRVSMQSDVTKLVADHPARLHPDWVITYGGKLYFNPGVPEAKRFVIDSVMEVVNNYDIDAVHFDDYFYPYKVDGVDFPDRETYQNYGAGFPDITDWRRNNVNAFIEELSKEMKQVKPYMKFGISPFGVWRNKATDPTGSDTTAGVENYDDLYADTRLWIQKGWIDYITPQIYWYFGFTPAAFEKLVDWWVKETEGTHTQLYIGHADYKVNDPNTPAWLNPDELPNQLKYLLNFDVVKGSMHFSTTDILNNPLGLKDRLSGESYRFKALVPEMPWLPANTPPVPKLTAAHVTGQGVHLSWEDAKNSSAAYYVIYRAEGNTAIDINDPKNILTTIRKINGMYQFYLDTTGNPGKQYSYAVTAADRLHNESNLSQSKTIWNQTLASIEIKADARMVVGQQQQIKVYGIAKNGDRFEMTSDLRFTSSSSSIMSVGEDGRVNAKQPGTATITVKYGRFLQGTLQIHVLMK